MNQQKMVLLMLLHELSKIANENMPWFTMQKKISGSSLVVKLIHEKA
jgi:hypothetical protein